MRAVRPGYTGEEDFRLNAAALDRVDEAEKLPADYEAHARRVGEAVEAKPGKIRLYAKKSFIGTYGDKAKTAQDAVLGGPLWATLGAVRAGHVKRSATRPGSSALACWPPSPC